LPSREESFHVSKSPAPFTSADFAAAVAADASSADRVDPAESRDTDYAMRAADGVNVKNMDTDKHYVLVAKTGHMLATYRALGYSKVPRTKDGPYIFAPEDEEEDALASSHVEFMDSVLMAIPMAKWRQIQQHGHPTGALGQLEYDKIEKQIVRNGGVDLMRGQMGRGLHMIPETSSLHRETD
jgi:hypothetical protein